MELGNDKDREAALKAFEAVQNGDLATVLELLPQLDFEGGGEGEEGDDFLLYQSTEKFVGSNSSEVVKRAYLAASDVEQPNWKMAIQTHIACGERKDLEETFPEWAGANPANHDWS